MESAASSRLSPGSPLEYSGDELDLLEVVTMAIPAGYGPIRWAAGCELVRSFFPHGKRLPALERSLLKYRAFEMMMILFHIESLKAFALGSYRATYRGRLPDGTRDLFKKLWAALVDDKVLTQAESAEIQEFIDYRNQIAHRIEDMTYDLSRDQFASDVLEMKGVQYRHGALKKIEGYRSLLEERMSSRYIMSLSLRGLQFESAEKTYKQELARLARQIRRQFAQRRQAEDKIQGELSSIAPEILDRLEPGHPENFLRNGRLSARGIECCYALFEYGLSDLAVSYILRLSYKAVRARRSRWSSSRGVLH